MKNYIIDLKKTNEFQYLHSLKFKFYLLQRNIFTVQIEIINPIDHIINLNDPKMIYLTSQFYNSYL
jgi:hypothetical protein